jgi:hypothetical protein
MTFSDSVGLGGYNMDSHNVQRYVTASGVVQNEGDIQIAPAKGPYPISYRAMVPRAGEAENLLVPVAVSASHIAYGSIRMEPVFMTLGQSAGAAAVIVGENAIAARDLPYAMLRSHLVRDEQMLGGSYVSPDAGILLNFGALVANDANSPGHALGGIPDAHWNLITGGTTTGINDSQGNAANLTINLGKSASEEQLLDWEATSFSSATGTALNTGLYAGNVRSALFVDNGSSSQVDIGVRISGLTEGIYDAFVTAKNTNTTTDEQYNVYSMLVDPASGNTDYSGAEATAMIHGLDAQWRHQESVVAETFQIIGQKDLVIVVEGVTSGELRGFLNTLEIVKLSGVLSADIDRDGDIDLDDFAVIQQHYLSNVVLGTNGDANSDGIVNQSDFFFWRERYLAQGGDANALQNVSIPEPSTAAGLLGAVPVLSHLLGLLKRTRMASQMFGNHSIQQAPNNSHDSNDTK